MYFVMKEAVYMHGVAWIGFDKNEGIRNAEIFAQSDKDSHHEWVLYRYVRQDPSPTERMSEYLDKDHDMIYSARNGQIGKHYD